MTGKRFTSARTDDYNFSDILDENGKWMGICHIDSADDFVKKFNELLDALNQRTEQCDKYYKENEQLKEQLQSILKLIKQIEDCTHDMKLIGDNGSD